jgi:plastocyanin
VVVVAAVAAGALYLAPMVGLGRGTATPTVQAPEPTALVTMLPPTTTPASAPSPTGDAPTSTLAPGLELLEPPDETTVLPGTEVTFQWRAIGMLPGSFSFAVMTSRTGFDELCRSDNQEACTVTLQEEGDYRWWAELQHSGQVLVTSSRRTLHVSGQPTTAPSPTLPESPITITVTP